MLCPGATLVGRVGGPLGLLPTKKSFGSPEMLKLEKLTIDVPVLEIVTVWKTKGAAGIEGPRSIEVGET
jgi:hypothetical protein